MNLFEFLSFSSEPKITYVYAVLCYSIVIFYLLFGSLMTNFAPLARTQFHSPDANHCVLTIIHPMVNGRLAIMSLLKLEMDCTQTHRYTD